MIPGGEALLHSQQAAPFVISGMNNVSPRE